MKQFYSKWLMVAFTGKQSYQIVDEYSFHLEQ